MCASCFIQVSGIAQKKKVVNTNKTVSELPVFPPEKSIAVDGSNLSHHYYLACGEEGARAMTQDIESLQQISCSLNDLDDRCRIRSIIVFGGFNPPPPHRRIVGDLAYLEVTLPNNEGLVHVTATPYGFYINRSNYSGNGDAESSSPNNFHFDPRPALKPCFSHELLDCLLQRSEVLRTVWVSWNSYRWKDASAF